MTANQFNDLDFDSKNKITQKKGKYILCELDLQGEKEFYSVADFYVEYKKPYGPEDPSITIIKGDKVKEILDRANEFKYSKKFLAWFRKLSAGEQKEYMSKSYKGGPMSLPDFNELSAVEQDEYLKNSKRW